MAAPNIVNVTSIYGKTIGAGLSTTATTAILTCPTNKVLKVNSIIVSNTSSPSNFEVTAYFYDSSETARQSLSTEMVVPANATLVILDKNYPIYLEESDRIEAGANASPGLDIIISYEEMDDA